MAEIKLVGFDMDNVIFDMEYFENRKGIAASSWSLVYGSLGAEKEDKKLGEKWANGGFKSYVDWQNAALEVYKKYGLTKKKFYEVINEIPLMKGAKDTFRELNNRGYKTAVITGSFQKLAERAQKELQIGHVIAASSLIFGQNGKLEDWETLSCGYEGKVNFFNDLASKLDLNLEQCALVCDGVNDIPLARKVGLSIAFNAREEVKRECDVVIEEKDLTKILDYL